MASGLLIGIGAGVALKGYFQNSTSTCAVGVCFALAGLGLFALKLHTQAVIAGAV